MKRALPLLLPALLLAACGQSPTTTSTPPTASTPAPGVPALQPGVYQISFQNVGGQTPQASAGSVLSAQGLPQGLIGTPDSFTFTRLSVDTFTASGIRHVQATFQVKNTGTLTYRSLKFVPVVTTGNSTPFTSVTYYDGSDASSKAGNLTAEQAQSFDLPPRTVTATPGSSPFLSGLDVSGVDTTGQNVSSVKDYGWQVAPTLAPGGTASVTFAVQFPMNSDADGAKKDPFNFNLTVTGVQDGVSLTSAVQQYSQSTRAFGNYAKFPTMTYADASGTQVTHSLPAYYDLKSIDKAGATQPAVLCGGDTAVEVKPDGTRSNRYRVELRSRGSYTLNVYAGTSCPSSGGTVLLSQTVDGVSPFVVPLAGGGNHSLALKADGTVQSWGYNFSGQLGTGRRGNGTDSSVPVTVSGLSDVVALAGGGSHSLALLADGTVRSWGLNDAGQLGNRSTTNSATPVTVTGLTGVAALAGGDSYSLALKGDGTVLSWGRNDNGQLGNGSTTNSFVPVAVSGLSGVVALSGGFAHSLALRADGTAQSWGSNEAGQLGNLTTANSSVPVPVSLLSGAVALSGDGSHSLALRADGNVQGWGFNGSGELGNGSLVDSSVPLPVSGLTNVAQPTP